MGWNQFQKKNKNIFKEIKDISFCLFFLSFLSLFEAKPLRLRNLRCMAARSQRGRNAHFTDVSTQD